MTLPARAALTAALGALADADALLARAGSESWRGAAAHGYEARRQELRATAAELTSSVQALAGPLDALEALGDVPGLLPGGVVGGVGRALVGATHR